MKHYPKILIVSDFFFNENSGGGILFKNLFYNFPSKNIFIIHRDLSVKDNKDYINICIKKENIILSFLRKNLNPIIKNLLVTLKNYSLRFKKKKIENSIYSKINEFNPDLIYTILGDYSLMCQLKEIHQKTKIPILLHIMDNFLANFESERDERYQLFKYFIFSSKNRLAINSEMAKDYKEKFDLSFSVIHNGISRNKIKKVNVKKDIKTILYIGSVYKEAQLDSLVDISNTIKNINLPNKKVKFILYLPYDQKQKYESKFLGSSKIEIKVHNLNDKEYFSILSQSDLLILASNFDFNSINYYKLSWPAKLPSYLMSKVPIFIYGPEEVFFVKEAKRKGWAYVQTKKCHKTLEKSLVQILSNQSIRNQIVKKAINESKNFNIEKIRDDFLNIINKTIEKK